jgi:prolyl-tRNA editing enzyme YbaK/EbsC (Cys-tRNA(Pro) deacylase)
MPNPNIILHKTAQSVQDTLLQHGLQFKVIELSASTRTANEAAAAIGCTVAQILKSLIFCTQTTNKPILVLASGVNRVNESTIGQHVGEKIIKASADFTREVTGFAIGGIPPIGHKQVIETFIDEDIFMHKELWAAAGTPHAVFSLSAVDINKLTSGKIISIK